MQMKMNRCRAEIDNENGFESLVAKCIAAWKLLPMSSAHAMQSYSLQVLVKYGTAIESQCPINLHHPPTPTSRHHPALATIIIFNCNSNWLIIHFLCGLARFLGSLQFVSYKLFIVFISSWLKMTGKLHYTHISGGWKVESVAAMSEWNGRMVSTRTCHWCIKVIRGMSVVSCPVRPGLVLSCPVLSSTVLSCWPTATKHKIYMPWPAMLPTHTATKSVTKTVKKRFTNFHNQQTWQKLYVPPPCPHSLPSCPPGSNNKTKTGVKYKYTPK